MYGVKHNDAGQAYYDSIISMYADWGVDFIKCDDICDSWMYPVEKFSGLEETRMIRRAIDKCGRPIVLSLSPGPAHVDNAYHYIQNANMWRITDDFWDSWELLKNMFWRCEQWQDHTREGCWPDCDMLPIGKLGKGHGSEWNSNFTDDELKTMMTLWCVCRSPLMIGTDLPQLDEKNFAILTNPDVLEMLKDGRARQLRRSDSEAVWISEGKGCLRIALFNLSDSGRTISVGIPEAPTVEGRELWSGETIKADGAAFSAEVPKHGVKIFKFAK